MKKFFLLFVGLLLLASPAFALQCKDGGSLNGDECWTDVYVSPIETSPTTVGTVVVYDFSAGTAEKAAYQVRVASASTDGYRVAGVVQKVIATGDWGRVLVRGKGKLRTVNILSSGDRLVVSPAANFGVFNAGVRAAMLMPKARA